MLVRAALVLRSGAAGRIARLLPDGVVAVRFAPRRDAVLDAARAACDLVVCRPEALGGRPGDTLGRLRAGGELVDVVVLRSEEDARERVDLLAAGCLAVLADTVEDDGIADALRSLVARHREAAIAHARREVLDGFEALASHVPEMRRILAAAQRVAPTDAPVLLLGETGVGKERLARAVHAGSLRAGMPFVPVNCAALPEALAESELFGHEAAAFTGADRARRGVFELAHGGTLFLDEVGDLSLAVQAKLLRAAQDGEVRPVGAERSLRVDVRILAATNRDLDAEVAAGRFRADLLFRLNAVTLALPPLRDRVADIAALATRQAAESARRLGRPAPSLSVAALESLLRHPWPGNIRELAHVIERAVLLCDGDEIGTADLGLPAARRAGLGIELSAFELPWHSARARAIEAFERAYLESLLRRSGGRIGLAARRAGISERALFAAMRRCGLRKEDYRAADQAAN